MPRTHQRAVGDRFVAQSAGTQPAGYVHPQAIAALREIGIDISHHHSKSTAEFMDNRSTW